MKKCTIVVQIDSKTRRKRDVLRTPFFLRMSNLSGESQGERCNWNILWREVSSR
jgi:hypothetical protein